MEQERFLSGYHYDQYPNPVRLKSTTPTAVASRVIIFPEYIFNNSIIRVQKSGQRQLASLASVMQ